MEITVTCRCGSKFSIQENCKNKGPFTCQNCSRPLPGDMSVHILKLLENYNLLTKDVHSVELYELVISNFKI